MFAMPWLLLAKIVAVFAVIGGIAFAYNRHVDKVVDRAVLVEKSAWITKLSAAETAARIKADSLQSKVDKGAKENESLRKNVAVAVASSKRATSMFNSALDQLSSKSTPATCVADERRVIDILRDCAEKYRGLAEESDRLAVKITGLQDYALSVSSP